ncbi:PHP domain-containing protein [Mycetocola lacteus]|uniref:PHP domain-containing protein n=1 Tax=Mycetocola lacteus TaxID=76637 RepID=A0A3L7AMV7_9MICO|nr:PHP domain-containing protein [Mycetocola lacteus]RLP80752.1 PHP domain-containing protein [Mycetocola lacteus]RLP84537.1 PHP domain-containing protein [Mycetocola lacteus]
MPLQSSLRGPADLHTHSSISDGTETPGELVRAAAVAGLGTVALTDHDTTAGWPEAMVAAPEVGVNLIPGMELSTRHNGMSVHMLAYLFDPSNPALLAETERIRVARKTRAAEIVENIRADYDLTWEDVLAQTTPGASIGRPHIADALVARGHSTDRSAAFETILHPRSGYIIPLYAPDPIVAIQMIREAGGVPVIAHPATGTRGRLIPEDVVAEMVEAGLFGMEIDHRENTPEGKSWLRALAARYNLVLTGSSDYHGAGKPNRLGENTTPSAVVDAIVAEATGFAPIIAD